MILKRLVCENWEYIDNISELQVGKTEEGKPFIIYQVEKDKTNIKVNMTIVLEKNNYAYLMNDNGKTIEVIDGEKGIVR